MQIYRYSSGNILRASLEGTRPELNVFFMPPTKMGDYPDPCIAYCENCFRPEDPDATKQYQRFDGTFVSNLDPRGCDNFVVGELVELRWLQTESVPAQLQEHYMVKGDKHPHKSQWFVARVQEDFIPQLEKKIASRLALASESNMASGQSPLLMAALVIIGIVLVLSFLH